MIRTELYFGLTRPGGADITDAEFELFLDEVVSPRFPAGHTILAAQGRWREQSGRLRKEASRVLVVLHPADERANRQLEEIRQLYKTRFAQEAVLRVDGIEKVAF